MLTYRQDGEKAMNKTIEKVELYKKNMIEKAIEKAKSEYAEADGSYRDTGYNRYYSKMQNKAEEIEELENYLNRDNSIQDAIREKKKVREELEEIKKKLKNKLFYLLAVIPECSEARSIRDYIEKL